MPWWPVVRGLSAQSSTSVRRGRSPIEPHQTKVVPATLSLYRGARSPVEPLEGRLLFSTYFVATDGSDANAGNLASPFRTIQKAANLARPGDVVQIRGGVYRETVRPAHSGTASAPIIYTPYNNESVIVSGADRITSFQQHNGEIYKTTVPWTLGEGNDQVFVDGQMMFEARWPNQTVGNVSRVATSSFDSAQYTLAANGVATGTITDDMLSQSAGFWVGATIHTALGTSGTVVTGNVIESSPGRLKFQVMPNSKNQVPRDGDTYFLSGKFQGLDTAGEWYRDNGGTLYLDAPGTGSPGNQVVEVKRRQYTFDFSDRSYITLLDIGTFAGTIVTSERSTRIVLDGLNAEYLSHYSRTDWKPNAGWLTGATDSGIILRGKDHVVRDSVISYSAGNGINTIGTNFTISNNVIHDINYSGTDGAAVNTLFAGSPNSGHVITGNTVFNTGRSGIRITGLKYGTVTYNTIYNFGLQTCDNGGIYAFNSDGIGTVIAYNTIRDGLNVVPGFMLAGIYLDEGSKNYTVHHNLVYNVGHALTLNGPSSNQKVYNNTFLGAMKGINTLANKTFPGTVLKNNIFQGTIPSMPGATFSNNLINDPQVKFVDVAANDYRLAAGSRGINTGSIIPGITDGFIGVLPDIGALEYNNNVWRSGSSFAATPNSPTHLIVTAFSSTRVDLRWRDNSLNENGFIIERSLDGLFFQQIAQVGRNTTVYADTELATSTKFYYRVRADDSPFSAVTSAQTDWGRGSALQAENYSAMKGISNYGSGIGSLDTDDWVRLSNFDFGNGVNQFSANLGLVNGNTGRKIEIRTGSPAGKLLGTLNVKPTGGWEKKTVQSTAISGASGVQDLYLVFKGGSGVASLDWYSLS